MKRKTKPEKLTKGEVEQVRIRRALGHAFGLQCDDHGRERLTTGTAESHRRYDRSKTGIVRLRLADPLCKVGLTPRQQAAGYFYRDCYEAAIDNDMTVKAVQIGERVDTGVRAKDISGALLDAVGSLAAVRRAAGHPDIALVLDHVCGLRMSLREVSERVAIRREAIAVLLPIGLDRIDSAFRNRLQRKHG